MARRGQPAWAQSGAEEGRGRMGLDWWEAGKAAENNRCNWDIKRHADIVLILQKSEMYLCIREG